jgi:hypothetical protein
MNPSTKLILVSTIVGMLGVAGVARLVSANQPHGQGAILQNLKSKLHAVNPSQKPDQGDGDGETNDDAKEQQELQTLPSLAKITPQQAQQAAEASVKGAANRVKLENEDGNLVYAVAVGRNEVKVDAGNGHVLYIDTVGNEQREGNRFKSSIQVPQSTADEDG